MRPAILDRLRGVQRAGKGWLCFCPAHDDRHKRSLSVGVGDDGHTLLKCHARNCTPEEITSAVNMSMADLAPGGPPSSPRRREVCTYQYTDGAGTLLYQVVRYTPKDFRQRRPDGQGGWTWNLDGVRRVVYRLPDLAEAPRVYWTEGEKDADRLATLGLTATTSPGGANAWRDDYAAQLGTLGIQDVVILPDHDAPGEHYAATVARACQATGLVVRVVRLPGLGEHGDVSDWLDAGGTREALLALAEGAPPFDPGAPDVTPAPVVADAAPTLRREGFDLSLTWADGVTLSLVAIRDGREGVRGELTVTQHGRRLSWGALALSSTSHREALRKRLDTTAPGPPWGARLDEAAYRLTQAARQGDPFVTLTGVATSPARELLPRLLYEGEPTLLFARRRHRQVATSRAPSPSPSRAAPRCPSASSPSAQCPSAISIGRRAATRLETRVALLAAGLGIDPPPILYKHMTRPLVDEAAALAAEVARLGVGLVVVDSMMFAVSGGDGAAFHEPITAFYGALRLVQPRPPRSC